MLVPLTQESLAVVTVTVDLRLSVNLYANDQYNPNPTTVL